MRLTSYAVTICLAVALSIPLSAQNTTPENHPTQVKAVVDYLLKVEYPEVYKKQPYRIRMQGFALGDVDGDGITEVFLLVDPHYQQTPSILIYRVGKDGTVRKLIEGLAPGPLIQPNGDRIDAHSLGLAFDATVGKENNPMAFRKLVLSTMKGETGCTMVLYPKFFHVDMPDHSRTFIDMTDRKEIKGLDTCEDIQFSKPSDIEVGKLKGVPGNPRLAVLVGRQCYLYRFTKITTEGFLEKQVTLIPCPDGATRIIQAADGTLAFQSNDPKTPDKPVALP